MMHNKAKRTLKQILLSPLLGLAACVTLKPTGHLDVAYVPERCDDQIVKNELMTELDLGLNLKVIGRDVGLTIGGRQRTYMPFSPSWIKTGFLPNRQEYDFYSNLEIGKNIEIYFYRMCSHPLIDDTERWIYDADTKQYYAINHDDITKVGARFKF